MSINISTGCTDTPISGVTAPSLTLPVINFETDFRVKSESGKETLLTNISCPLDQIETIRFGYSEIPDIYAKSGINSDFVPGSKKGLNVLAQINEIVKVTDSANTAYMQYLPISAHLVIKAPQSGYITPDVIKALITRLNATLYQSGVSSIPSLTKGVLTPKGI